MPLSLDFSYLFSFTSLVILTLNSTYVDNSQMYIPGPDVVAPEF